MNDWVVDRPRHVERAPTAGYVGPGSTRKGSSWPLDRAPLFLESSHPGLFVAGDVRQGSIKRVASAVGEGAMAVALIHQYLSSLGS